VIFAVLFHIIWTVLLSHTVSLVVSPGLVMCCLVYTAFYCCFVYIVCCLLYTAFISLSICFLHLLSYIKHTLCCTMCCHVLIMWFLVYLWEVLSCTYSVLYYVLSCTHHVISRTSVRSLILYILCVLLCVVMYSSCDFSYICEKSYLVHTLCCTMCCHVLIMWFLVHLWEVLSCTYSVLCYVLSCTHHVISSTSVRCLILYILCVVLCAVMYSSCDL